MLQKRHGLVEPSPFGDRQAAARLFETAMRRPTTWTCDACGEPIARATHGRVEWLRHVGTGRVRGLQLVHVPEKNPSRPRPERTLHLVRDSTARADRPSCNHQPAAAVEELAWIPLQHLTDDDGLTQLLERIAAGELSLAKLLEITQRLHVPMYEDARPLLAEAVVRGFIKPNLLPGFHWQGDLAEALRLVKQKQPVASARTTEQPCDADSARERDVTLGDFLERAVDSNGGAALHEAVMLIAEAGIKLAGRLRQVGTKSPADAAMRSVHGETVKELDAVAHATFVRRLSSGRAVAAVASEESIDIVPAPSNEDAPLLVALDPLDGSENVEFGLAVGSIFSVRPRRREGPVIASEFLRSGREQLAAGYLVYGTSVCLALAIAGRLAMFVLDPANGCFVLTRDGWRMPHDTAVLSVNHANAPYWPEWVSTYVDSLTSRNGSVRRLISRFSGAMVADLHRNLLAGGVFVVPEDRRNGRGKLRMLYECQPLALVVEAAGGAASDGRGPLLDLVPRSLHERTPFVTGPTDDVALAEQCVARAGTPALPQSHSA